MKAVIMNVDKTINLVDSIPDKKYRKVELKIVKEYTNNENYLLFQLDGEEIFRVEPSDLFETVSALQTRW